MMSVPALNWEINILSSPFHDSSTEGVQMKQPLKAGAVSDNLAKSNLGINNNKIILIFTLFQHHVLYLLQIKKTTRKVWFN